MTHLHKLRLGRLSIKYSRRVNEKLGRFGGCWDWKLGVQASTSLKSWLISLLVVEIVISWRTHDRIPD